MGVARRLQADVVTAFGPDRRPFCTTRVVGCCRALSAYPLPANRSNNRVIAVSILKMWVEFEMQMPADVAPLFLTVGWFRSFVLRAGQWRGECLAQNSNYACCKSAIETGKVFIVTV